ncbi:hypothetical protein KCP75_13880 [Salmonella enterica subsp. enterica]|nr:hypothetical protein KCP75_13880 [Salmonella enterica subsp. enterica]
MAVTICANEPIAGTTRRKLSTGRRVLPAEVNNVGDSPFYRRITARKRLSDGR